MSALFLRAAIWGGFQGKRESHQLGGGGTSWGGPPNRILHLLAHDAHILSHWQEPRCGMRTCWTRRGPKRAAPTPTALYCTTVGVSFLLAFHHWEGGVRLVSIHDLQNGVPQFGGLWAAFMFRIHGTRIKDLLPGHVAIDAACKPYGSRAI